MAIGSGLLDYPLLVNTLIPMLYHCGLVSEKYPIIDHYTMNCFLCFLEFGIISVKTVVMEIQTFAVTLVGLLDHQQRVFRRYSAVSNVNILICELESQNILL